MSGRAYFVSQLPYLVVHAQTLPSTFLSKMLCDIDTHTLFLNESIGLAKYTNNIQLYIKKKPTEIQSICSLCKGRKMLVRLLTRVYGRVRETLMGVKPVQSVGKHCATVCYFESNIYHFTFFRS